MRTVVVLVLLGFLGCATRIARLRAEARALYGRSSDDVLRKLGAPLRAYALPVSRRAVWVYEAARASRSAIVADALAGAGAGLGGRPAPPHAQTPEVCQFELEFDEAGLLTEVRERGGGC